VSPGEKKYLPFIGWYRTGPQKNAGKEITVWKSQRKVKKNDVLDQGGGGPFVITRLGVYNKLNRLSNRNMRKK